MKKVLLGTTALMAGGLVAGAASAADIVPAPIPEPIEEGFTLSINGDALAAFSFRSTDECDDFEAVHPDGLVHSGDWGPEVHNAVPQDVQDLTLAHIQNAEAGIPFGDFTFGPCAYKNGHAVEGTGSPFFDDSNLSGYHEDEATHIYWDSGLDITAEITLANGLNVAVYLEADWFDDVNVGDYWIALSGHWGTFEIGNTDGAYKQSLVWVPGAGGIATVDGGDGQPSLGIGNFPNGPLDEPSRGLVLNYFTPRLAGFQFGVSYSPDTDGTDQSDGNNHVLDSDDAYVHGWQVGLNWEHEFAGGWALAIGGGYGAASAESQQDSFEECVWSNLSDIEDSSTAEEAFGAFTGDYECGDQEAWGIGAEFSGSVLTVGGGYTELSTDFGRTRSVGSIEGVATFGPWQAGLGYSHEQDDHAYGGFEDDANIIAAGLAKDIAPGVQLGGFLYWIETEEAYHTTLGVGAVDSFAVGTSIVTRW